MIIIKFYCSDRYISFVNVLVNGELTFASLDGLGPSTKTRVPELSKMRAPELSKNESAGIVKNESAGNC